MKWLDAWWPSARLKRDPLANFSVDQRYRPVSVANWKLTPWVASELISRRVERPLTFSLGERLTVVIPFRDREAHLRESIPLLRSMLDSQQVTYRILIVEQEPGALFNRGKLINVGFHHAADSSDYYCVHDVDAVPLVANYGCPSQPLRLVNKIHTERGVEERTNYYFSGAVSVRKDQVFAAGGFSNEYWGWGKEDDDFFFRLLLAGCLCFYDSLGEFRDLPNPAHQQVIRKSPNTPPHVHLNRKRRSMLLRRQIDPKQDGLETLKYDLLAADSIDAYDRIRVRI